MSLVELQRLVPGTSGSSKNSLPWQTVALSAVPWMISRGKVIARTPPEPLVGADEGGDRLAGWTSSR